MKIWQSILNFFGLGKAKPVVVPPPFVSRDAVIKANAHMQMSDVERAAFKLPARGTSIPILYPNAYIYFSDAAPDMALAGMLTQPHGGFATGTPAVFVAGGGDFGGDKKEADTLERVIEQRDSARMKVN
jgi:hypothetical protein